MSESIATLLFCIGICFHLVFLYIVHQSIARHRRSRLKHSCVLVSLLNDRWDDPQAQDHSVQPSVYDRFRDLTKDNRGPKHWVTRLPADHHQQVVYVFHGDSEEGKQDPGDRQSDRNRSEDRSSIDDDFDQAVGIRRQVSDEDVQTVTYDPRPRRYDGVHDFIGVPQEREESGERRGGKRGRRRQGKGKRR